MTYIAPLPEEAITDPELRALMAEGEALGVPNDLFPRVLARAPEQAVPLMRALIMSHTKGNVDHRLKEIMRILLARFVNDGYFGSLRSNKAHAMGLTEARIDDGCFAYEDDAKSFSAAEICALRYADLMFLDANQIDSAFYDEMKNHWSEAQIMELGAFIAFHYGMQMFMRSLGAVPWPPLIFCAADASCPPSGFHPRQDSD